MSLGLYEDFPLAYRHSSLRIQKKKKGDHLVGCSVDRWNDSDDWVTNPFASQVVYSSLL